MRCATRSFGLGFAMLALVRPGLCGFGACSASAQVAEPATPVTQDAEGVSHLEIATSPLLSLHMLCRAGAAGAEVPECVRPAVEAIRAVGDEMQWGVTDGLFATAERLDAAREVLAAMSTRFPAGVGERVVAYVDALAAAEPAFRESIWPKHERQIEAARVGLEDALDAHGSSVIARACELLGMADPCKAIPVYLVVTAPSPGGFTALSRRSGAVCVVSVDAHEGSTLVEATLHEAIHALDTHTRQQQPPTVLQVLRKALADAGVSATDARMRDVVHTVIFAAAADVTREVVDPKHVAYGEAGGYYAKVPEAKAAVLPAWERYAAARIDRDEFVKEIVAGVTTAR